MLTPLLVQLSCKLALNSIASVSVKGLSHIQAALDNVQNTGLITLANHISTLDDPLFCGVLPTKYVLRSRTTRWTLGASDIMFTNPYESCRPCLSDVTLSAPLDSVFSAFFRRGQVLETFRGNGIYQPSVDAAIEKLNRGNWIHLFGEGKVNQPSTYPQNDGVAYLPRFKWGVGRVLMEVSNLPPIIPIWLSGFDSLMPEGRAFPYKYFPRPGHHLSVTFGEPLDLRELEALRTSAATPERIRIAMTDVVHDAVEALGHRVSGPLLTRTP